MSKPGTKRVCLRCSHEWYQARFGVPVKCPKCGSPYWDRPRQESNKKTA